jgi:acetylornithine/LysW-gamma-L-lysine aminotransferase
VLIVKMGGGDLDLDGIAADLAGLSRPFVLVHGANRLRDEMAVALGRPSRVVESISGYTSVLSDDDAIDVLLAAYAGVRNKRIVEALRKAGVDALGLTGLDGGLVTGARNRGIRVERDGKKLLLRDQSGKPSAVNGDLLRALLRRGHAPVLTVPICGEEGEALNSENDEVLALLAAELGATDVVSLIEAPGLLADANDEDSLVLDLDPADLEGWESRVQGRMRRKVRALRSLFDRCAPPGPRFRLADGRVCAPVSAALAGGGTLVARREAGECADHTDLNASWLRRQAAHELDVYGKRGIVLVSGWGARVTDAAGREYIDCVGGHGSLALGHRHPALAAALAEQAEAIWFVPGAFGSPPRARFLERLHSVLPPELDRTFLSSSGTESMEAALKIARAHTGRAGFVGALRGFHGRTMGALSLTAESYYREAFEPLPGPVTRVRWNDASALEQAVDAQVAAVVLEPVQGEGGVYPADPSFLAAARAACDATGALLIFDEVQTGFGRTGRLFAFEHSGVVPDVLCLAKSIAGGLPLGATVVRRGIDLAVGLHGSTFGGNPIACAVADATLRIMIEEDLPARAETLGHRIAERVRAAAPAAVREVRQIGLMIGIQTRTSARPYVDALAERGVLALVAGSKVLRLLPPLVLRDEDAEAVGTLLVEVLSEG